MDLKIALLKLQSEVISKMWQEKRTIEELEQINFCLKLYQDSNEKHFASRAEENEKRIDYQN